MAVSIACLEQRRLFDRTGCISLKIALFVAIGIELALCFLGAGVQIWLGEKVQLLFQLIEAAVCMSVFYAIYKGKAKYLLVYLGYNLFDIALVELVTFPKNLAASRSKYDFDFHNGTLCPHVPIHTNELRLYFTSFSVACNGYLLLAGLTWWLVYSAYKELSKAANRQFEHQPFSNTSNESLGTESERKISAVLNSNGLGGSNINGATSVADWVGGQGESA